MRPLLLRTLLLMLLSAPVFTGCNHKEEAQPTQVVGDGLSSADAAILDEVPSYTADLTKIVLPNGEFLLPWAVAHDSAYFHSHQRGLASGAISGPIAKMNTLVSRLVGNGAKLADPTKHTYPAEGQNKPAQVGIRYKFGQRDWTNRDDPHAMSTSGCPERLHGLDCSGLLYNIFTMSEVNISDGNAATQFNADKLTQALKANSEFKNLYAQVMPDNLPKSKMKTGDIIYWPVGHIGLITSERTLTGSAQGPDRVAVLQSNGSSESTDKQCLSNASPKRGVRYLNMDQPAIGDAWITKAPYTAYRVIRIMPEISGKWKCILKCAGLNDLVSTELTFPTRDPADAKKDDFPFVVNNTAKDYNGNMLDLTFIFNYNKPTNVLSCEVHIAANGKPVERKDSFSVELLRDATGDITCQKILNNNQCTLAASLENLER